MDKHSPMRIRLSPERRASVINALKKYFVAEFEELLSDVRAASGFMQEKLSDIEGEAYERETAP